jgi:two-component system cell cycle sensor histidine kinase/response regulator CckA
MLRSLIQDISEIVAVIDANGIIRFSSPQLKKILGLRTEDVVGRNIFHFIHPDDVGRTSLEYAETVQKPGEGVPSSLRVRDASGVWIPFEIIANNKLNDPNVQGVIFTARDLRFRQEIENEIRLANADVEKRIEERITELAKANASLRLENQSRRETERQLHETVSLLNATLNSTADGILAVGSNRKVTGCNRRFIEMWNLQCDSVVGRNEQEMLGAVADQVQDPGEFLSKVQALHSEPSATSFDLLYCKGGRIYERYSQPQRLGGRITGRVWSFRDVTQAKHLEQELQHSQKMEALGRLAGGVAHDFNNLLMLIMGYLGQLSDSNLSPEQRQRCEEATTATRRAAALTGQLLAFSRKHPKPTRVTNLNLMVSNMQGMLRTLISERTRLDISLSDDPVPLLADVSQLEVVLMNLAINAQDAMPGGGVLSVSTDRQVQDSKRFGVLTVSDTGWGMTPDVLTQIFTAFFTTKELGKGTGLGLSTVHRIVQGLGGRIEVQSQPNHGSRFRVYLPETVAIPDTSAGIETPAPPTGGHETILLAEDEAGIRAMTKAYLDGLRYHVLEAADGAEAVKISREYQGAIDLVVTDVLMPILRGDAVVSSIRERRPDIKALYISGCLEDPVADKTAEVLLKPFEFPELGRRVRSILDAHRGSRPFTART